MEILKNTKTISQWYDEESLFSTEFRRLYSKLRNLNPGKEIKNLLITSANVGEGKRTSAALMAVTIAKYRGTNTLLIDCDVRRPTIHKIFGMERQDGFSDVALKLKDFKSVIKDSFVSNLKILTSGELTRSPAEIFNLLNLKALFAEY